MSPTVVIPMHEKLAVGGIAGVIGTCFVFPLDMCKTRLQAQKPDPKTGKLPYTGMLQCFRSILKADGAAGLYRGLVPNLVGVTPEKALKLACNDFFREKLADPDGTVSTKASVLAGGGAGFCQVAATNPMEITKIRMQLQSTLPVAERQTLGQVCKELGFAGMYTGVVSTWCRDVPYSFIFFPLVAVVREAMMDDQGNIGVMANLFAGGASGAGAAGLCTPMDVVKTRFQAPGGVQKYGSISGTWSTIYKEEGFGAFWKGVGPRMGVSAPLFGIAILAFEMQKDWIIKNRGGSDQPL